MCSVWIGKCSATSMDANELSMDGQVLCYQYGCQLAQYGWSSALLPVWMPMSSVWMAKCSAISMVANVLCMDGQVFCYQYGCQCAL